MLIDRKFSVQLTVPDCLMCSVAVDISGKGTLGVLVFGAGMHAARVYVFPVLVASSQAD